MGMLNILIALVLLGIIIFFVVRLLPNQGKGDDNVCPKCDGTGRIEELRGKVLCPKCKGTGKAKW